MKNPRKIIVRAIIAGVVGPLIVGQQLPYGQRTCRLITMNSGRYIKPPADSRFRFAMQRQQLYIWLGKEHLEIPSLLRGQRTHFFLDRINVDGLAVIASMIEPEPGVRLR